MEENGPDEFSGVVNGVADAIIQCGRFTNNYLGSLSRSPGGVTVRWSDKHITQHWYFSSTFLPISRSCLRLVRSCRATSPVVNCTFTCAGVFAFRFPSSTSIDSVLATSPVLRQSLSWPLSQKSSPKTSSMTPSRRRHPTPSSSYTSTLHGLHHVLR